MTPTDLSDPFGRILRDTTTEMVWAGVVGGRGLTCTGNVERVCGCSPDELLESASTVWVDRADPGDRERVADAFGRLQLTGVPFDHEYRWQRLDGCTIWIRGRAVLRPGATVPTIDAVFVDVTDRRRLIEQIRHLQKTEAVGEFTVGIVHDFNNMLAAMLANLTLLLDACEPDDPRRAEATAAVEIAERAAALTRQLLPFTRRHTFEPRPIDLNEVLRHVEPLLRRLIGQDVVFVLRLASALPSVHADSHLLEQVIVNLSVNARDAMPHGGTLAIATELQPNGSVRVTVSDTGCGMDADTRHRAFEPFFTTKPQGRGTGLGLATARAIIQECGGEIGLDSEPGSGSIFEITLPAVLAAPAAAAVPESPSWRAYPGRESILVVEDDDRVRALVQRMLTSLGYEVVCARDAEDALTAVHAGSRPFALVLSDVILPGANGAEVSRAVQARARDTRVLYMSGHSLSSLVERGLLTPDDQFLQKPFTPATLAKRVREALDV